MLSQFKLDGAPRLLLDDYSSLFNPAACEDVTDPQSHEITALMRGYQLFKDRCVRCHAMDGQGGTIGPDLNAPMSVAEYRSHMMIREFIRHPSRYRHTYMPDHEDLSDQDLDDLPDYFRHQARADKR